MQAPYRCATLSISAARLILCRADWAESDVLCIDTLPNGRIVLSAKYTHIGRSSNVDAVGFQDFLIVIAQSTKLDPSARRQIRLKSVVRKEFSSRNMTMLWRVGKISLWMKAWIIRSQTISGKQMGQISFELRNGQAGIGGYSWSKLWCPHDGNGVGGSKSPWLGRLGHQNTH